MTLVILSEDAPDPSSARQADFSITLDAPRLVLGRSEGCDVRLPDPTVSHRHASIRQRGGEHVLIDENSANGTFLGRVRLPPQTPRVLRSGERIRLGRVWLEVRFEPVMVKGSTAQLAKELALSLVTRGLASQGEDATPRLRVVNGEGTGTELSLAEPMRSYVLGKAVGSDLQLIDAAAGRRHATVLRKADSVVVTDCGAAGGTLVDGQPIREATLRTGQALTIGATSIEFIFPAAEALAEIERCPDERLADTAIDEPPRAEAADTSPSAPDADAPDSSGESARAESSEDAGHAPSADTDASRRALKKRSVPGEGWGAVDSVVILIALGVIAASIAGALWVFAR